MDSFEPFEAELSDGLNKINKRLAKEKSERVEVQKNMIKILENMEIEAK